MEQALIRGRSRRGGRGAVGIAAALLVLAGLVSGDAVADDVFKCKVDGAIIYQSEPCDEGESATVAIAPPPSDAEIADAERRIEAQRSVATNIAGGRRTQSQSAQYPSRNRSQENCSQLSSRLAEASNRRNAALNAARRGSGADEDVAKRNWEVSSLAGKLQARGCEGNE